MSSHSIPIDKKALRRALPSHSSCGRPQLKARPARTPRAVFMFCVSSQKMRSRDGSEQLKKSQATKSLKSGSTSYLHLCVVVVTEPANARSANATAVWVRCDLAKDRNFDVISALPCSTDPFAAIALHTDSTAESVWSCTASAPMAPMLCCNICRRRSGVSSSRGRPRPGWRCLRG